MSDQIRICVDAISPVGLRVLRQAASAMAPRSPTPPAVRALAPIRSIWPNGSTLRVKFLGGTPSDRTKVEQAARQWMQHANLRFEFVGSGASEIRVSFVQDGRSWSYVGTDNLNIPGQSPTMNFGWPLEQGTILHEFGHAIGLGHEHQNPAGGLQWDEPVVLRELAGPPNEWDEDTIRHNVLNKYRQDQIRGTAFDSASIMLYAFPARWTLNGVSTNENNALSATDMTFVGAAQMYPFLLGGDTGVVELLVADNSGTEGEIGKAGEEDLFTFKAKQADAYTVETEGSTDVVMRLFGPNNRTTLIAEDDDNGAGNNARLVVNLNPGDYFVQVRHFNPHAATGKYRIKVSR